MSDQNAAQVTPEAAGGSKEVTTIMTEASPAQPASEPAKEAIGNSGNEPAKQETKPSEAQAEKADPKEYTLKLPEKSPLDESASQRIAAYAKERGLTNEQAQELLNRESEAVSNYAKAQTETYQKEIDGWKAKVSSDKEIGGEAFQKNVELAKRVVDRFGSEDFKKALNDTGLGNHPELVRVFFKIGKLMSEDQLVMPGTQQAPKSRDVADLLYGDNKQK